MASDDFSDLSSLSSLSPPPPSDSESEPEVKKKGILKFFTKVSKDKMAAEKEPSPPPPRKREPSPPHEPQFADNQDIAFIVMFRNRFDDAFARSLPSFGPQELEYDLTEAVPGSRAEAFLCAVLGLLLNRKQDVKAGHYNRALEDAISSHKSQWPRQWDGKSPLSGGGTFASMTATERLTLLRTLILWAMGSSEAIRAILAKSYKQNRHEDDLNQPLSVQPWGSDSDKRRYYLIEGRDYTSFRVYRESNPAGFKRTWWSVADSIESITALADKLENEDGGPKAKRLSQGIQQAIPRLLESEEKRRRREYRQRTKERFRRPEPGFSLYEGRTRGKRVKYTYSDDEDEVFSDYNVRRSSRNTRNSTPAENGSATTQSGRQVRPPTRLHPETGSAGGSVLGDTSDTNSRQEDLGRVSGRPRRAAAANGWADQASRRNGDAEEEAETSSPDLGDDESDEEHIPEESNDEDEFNEDEELLDEDLDVEDAKSLVVKVSVNGSKLKGVTAKGLPTPSAEPTATTSTQGGPEVVMNDAPAASTSEAPEKQARPTVPELAVKGDSETATPLPPVLAPTPLALRGSPEKPQNAPRPIDIGAQL
ncbi:Uncharacterized protein SAPIO_CDS7681 [Scedosporium apiospermum]|uniref:WHIM1 domain-containing protein n=1 Tax=Pseudallescheria apiosperma TaxID=563466 RepID=A0A084G2G0_PSEDA|nr:Uncharacterized protein SAPIO_CDS7681 [Scedosporium apiospermum]KEZ41522.1 Uncharacterized protein SAPIO_CDS7681 [Scedosporium apiospermum]